MNQIAKALNSINSNQHVHQIQMQIVKKWVMKITNCLPSVEQVKFGSLSYEGDEYFILSIPLDDVFNNPWNVQNMNLSTVLHRASKEVKFVTRFQKLGTASGLAIRFKLSN